MFTTEFGAYTRASSSPLFLEKVTVLTPQFVANEPLGGQPYTNSCTWAALPPGALMLAALSPCSSPHIGDAVGGVVLSGQPEPGRTEAGASTNTRIVAPDAGDRS